MKDRVGRHGHRWLGPKRAVDAANRAIPAFARNTHQGDKASHTVPAPQPGAARGHKFFHLQRPHENANIIFGAVLTKPEERQITVRAGFREINRKPAGTRLLYAQDRKLPRTEPPRRPVRRGPGPCGAGPITEVIQEAADDPTSHFLAASPKG